MNDYIEEILEQNWEMDDQVALDADQSDMESDEYLDECEAF
ncbi:hypothetical protein TDB9533_01310 [Thalassocella blandensis]|nr:hypothetical protein TDB9533_01310 [Thalassocella blandensis]